MTIETERLNLIPLTSLQLRLWVEDISSLEKELNCVYRAEPLEGEFLDIVKGQIEITEKDEINYLYHSFWLLIRKIDRVVIGSACFKNVPDENKEVEIGYGLGEKHKHQGYMTETIRAMCDWAAAQGHIVIAETEAGNLASENVLKRCGFIQCRQDETIWWRLQR